MRNTVTGLDGVPADVKDAATGMGYSRTRRLLRVELPLALPAIIAGIRIATVTTIGLVTVTALIGQGGLGPLMLDGLQRDFRTPLTVGIVLSLALAVVADLLLLGAAPRHAVARAGERTAKGDGADGLPRRRLRLPHRRATSGTATRASRPSACSTCSSRSCRCSSAALIALPIGIVARPRAAREARIAVNIANIGRALPALALLILAVQWVGIGEPDRVLTTGAVGARVHRHVRPRGPADGRQRLRRDGRPSTTRSASRRGAWA